jgi:hypothetical protein
MTFLYPTASTTAVFINGYHVEQAYQIQYKENVNKVPIYGYSDYTYSKIAVGRTLVQGILVLNFVSPGYLSAVLEKRESTIPKKLRNFGFSAEGNSEKQQLEEDIKNEIRTELPTLDSEVSRNARAEYIANLFSKQLPLPTSNKRLKEALFNTFTEESNNRLELLNNVKKTESSISLNNTNDLILDIYYSDPQYALWWVRFENVHFYETSQTISQAGAEGSSDPLYEVYPWIASKKMIHMVQ